MSSRRALLTVGLASLPPFVACAQGPSRARELLSPLLPRYRVPGSVLVFAADGSFGVSLMTNAEGSRQLIPEFLAALFEAFGHDRFGPAN